MAVKMKFNLADVLELTKEIPLSADPSKPKMEVRGLELSEVIKLLTEEQDLFVTAWNQATTGKNVAEQFSGILAVAPDFVDAVLQKVVVNMDPEPEYGFKRLPPTVQLIALNEVFKLTCPDPKSAGRLLSEVTALLRRVQQSSETSTKDSAVPNTQSNSPKNSAPTSS